ncbi:MAG: TIGR01777 family oxidoreductase [Eikenella sp.]|nr:TIGR01777 family oxidoreductase [Eikenella sp.]
MTNQSPTLVLIGGSGLIGRHLAAAFRQDSWRVLIVSRDPNRARQDLGGRYEYVASLNHLYADMPIDLVVNLAGASIGEGKWTPQRKQALLNSRLQATRVLGEWLQQRTAGNRPKLVVQASAVGYYGNGRADGWPHCTESAPPQAVFASQLCQQWEAAAQTAAQAGGVPLVICRFGVVLARDGGILPRLLKPVAWCVGKIGGGEQPLPWIHIDDVAHGIRFLYRLPPARRRAVYNFTAPQITTQADFVRTAARALHRPLLFGVPAAVMRGLMGEQADLVLEGQFAVPQALLADGYRFRFPELPQALADLLNVQ